MGETIKCPICAFEISDNSEICMLCGAKLNSARHQSFDESESKINLDLKSAAKHFTASELFFIMFMAITGIIVGGVVGFYGGIAVCWLAAAILNCGFSSLVEMVFGHDFLFFYKETPIVIWFLFFETMLVFGCYAGGSFGKLICRSNRFNDYCCSINYSNYFKRLFRAWIYTIIGVMINVHLFIIMDIMTRGSIAGRDNSIISEPVLIVVTTILSIRLAKKHYT